MIDVDGTVRVRPKEPAMERLQAVKQKLATHDVDVEAMRRESKAVWSSYYVEDSS